MEHPIDTRRPLERKLNLGRLLKVSTTALPHLRARWAKDAAIHRDMVAKGIVEDAEGWTKAAATLEDGVAEIDRILKSPPNGG